MDKTLPSKNAALFSSLESALIKYKSVKKLLDAGHREKIFKYPIMVTLSKFLIKVFPSTASWFVVENKLFSGVPFFTEGYYMDYRLCGLPNSDPEIRLTKYFIKNIIPDDIFFDVGANFGFYTVLAHAILGDDPARRIAQIHAFEPTPPIFKVLSKNVGRKNVVLNNFALGIINGEADFVFFDSIKEFNGLSANMNEEEFKIVGHTVKKVLVRTLDDYCEKEEVVPTIMKIDVEGSEGEVLRGGLSIIARNHPIIVMEIHTTEKHRAAAKILMDMGYSLYGIDDHGDLMAKTTTYLENLTELDNLVFKQQSDR